MKLVIILGIIFVLWEGLITHYLPKHSKEQYEKAAEKWSTGLPYALIGIMDFVSGIGLVAVCIASFFVMPIIDAVIFCVIIGIIILFNPSARRSSREYSRALRGKK
jgi:pilus assembly protein TadC